MLLLLALGDAAMYCGFLNNYLRRRYWCSLVTKDDAGVVCVCVSTSMPRCSLHSPSGPADDGAVCTCCRCRVSAGRKADHLEWLHNKQSPGDSASFFVGDDVRLRADAGMGYFTVLLTVLPTVYRCKSSLLMGVLGVGLVLASCVFVLSSYMPCVSA